MGIKKTPESNMSSEPASDESMTLKVCLYSGIDGIPIMKLTYTPLPSKNGERVRFTRNSLGHTPFVKEYEDCKVNTEMRICLALQQPTQVGLYYKGHEFMWKQKQTLAQLKKEEADLREVNEHSCEEFDCDPDSHDMGEGDFWDFIQSKICHIMDYGMRYDSKRLRVAELLEGKECPVLLEPLKVDRSLLLNCGHMLSRTAWAKQQGINCPLCRACGHGDNFEHL